MKASVSTLVLAPATDCRWHGQRDFARSGLCQETCRDLGHVQFGFATLINTAQTAYLQGLDLYERGVRP